MTRALLFIMALTLAGCAGGPPLDPKIVTQVVDHPVPVRCAPNIGPEPAYPDTDDALRSAPDLFTRVKLLVAGRGMRIARDVQKSAALAGCAGQ